MFNLFKKSTKDTLKESQQEIKEFTDIREKWKVLAANHKIRKEDMAALCLYRAIVNDDTYIAIVNGSGKAGAISRLKKSFSKITNTVKLQNGVCFYGELPFALQGICWSSVYDWLTPDEQKLLYQLAKSINARGEELV